MIAEPSSTPATDTRTPLKLSAIVIHWRNEAEVQSLIAGWPNDPRLELIVVDNSGNRHDKRYSDRGAQIDHGAREAETDSAETDTAVSVQWIVPPSNLGFGGGANLGISQAQGEWVLILNPDITPEPGALTALLDACERYQDAVGIAPALVNPDGTSQCSWQLQPLPSPATLILQTLFLGGRRGPKIEPEEGALVEQPAAAALAIRRQALIDIDGFDERFFPAWFEDVDLAKRLASNGQTFRYTPAARFVHATGGSVPALGYGPFLWIYYRNLEIYLGRHHSILWIWLARLTLPLAMTARLLALPLRQPRRANSRRAAALGLLAVLLGCLSSWRRPRIWAERFGRHPTEPPR